MFWKQGKGAEPGSWHGPARIIMLEHPNTIWISHLTRLYRCAPEHIRSVSSREQSQSVAPPSGLSDLTSGVVQYRNLQAQSSSGSSGNVEPRVDTLVPNEHNSAMSQTGNRPRLTSGLQPDAEPEANSNTDTPQHQSNNINNPQPDVNTNPQSISTSISQAINTPIPADDEDGLIMTFAQDAWEIQGELLIRHHRRPRLNRFFPQTVPMCQLALQRYLLHAPLKESIGMAPAFASMMCGKITLLLTAHSPMRGLAEQSLNFPKCHQKPLTISFLKKYNTRSPLLKFF